MPSIASTIAPRERGARAAGARASTLPRMVVPGGTRRFWIVTGTSGAAPRLRGSAATLGVTTLAGSGAGRRLHEAGRPEGAALPSAEAAPRLRGFAASARGDNDLAVFEHEAQEGGLEFEPRRSPVRASAERRRRTRAARARSALADVSARSRRASASSGARSRASSSGSMRATEQVAEFGDQRADQPRHVGAGVAGLVDRPQRRRPRRVRRPRRRAVARSRARSGRRRRRRLAVVDWPPAKAATCSSIVSASRRPPSAR